MNKMKRFIKYLFRPNEPNTNILEYALIWAWLLNVFFLCPYSLYVYGIGNDSLSMVIIATFSFMFSIVGLRTFIKSL